MKDHLIVEAIPWLTYLIIPVVSGLVGWITNVIAIQMTFYPLEYVGLRPFGWQGIIPSKSRKIAVKSVDLLTIKLLRMEDHFALLDPHQVAVEMEPALRKLSRQIIDEVMDARAYAAWASTPQTVKKLIYARAADDLPWVIVAMMKDVKEQINDLLDLKVLAVQALVKDKALLNEIFLRCGKKEFVFLERSGFYFGFLFGLIQMGLIYFYQAWWILPVFGFLVGYFTNWLAIKLIFWPLKPINFGLFTWQGLFLKRQHEVSEEYSAIVANKILSTEVIFEFIIRGPSSKKLVALVQKHVGKVIESTAGVSRSLFNLIGGEGQIHIVRNIATYRMMQELPIAIRDMYAYAEKALNIEGMLKEKMALLSKDEFVGFLRPPFQEDEFTLILVGAILGGLAGLGQYWLLVAT